MNLDHPSNCLTFNLLRAARTLARRLDAALSGVDLSAQQFTILAQMAHRPSVATSQLGDLTGTERTTVTRNLARLSDRGLIEPDTTGTDRRVNAWQLTPDGRRLYEQALPLWREAQTNALSGVVGITPDALLTTLRDL